MKRYQCLLFAVLLGSALVAASPGSEAQQGFVQAGRLTCRLNSSIGFVIFGHQSMECRFEPIAGPLQAYEGAINTVGIDLGVTEGGRFAWSVFGPAAGIQYGSLAGEYVGASADVGLGVGAGANVLLGGFARNIALQPLSLEGSVALNVVGGLSQLQLRLAQ